MCFLIWQAGTNFSSWIAIDSFLVCFQMWFGNDLDQSFPIFKHFYKKLIYLTKQAKKKKRSSFVFYATSSFVLYAPKWMTCLFLFQADFYDFARNCHPVTNIHGDNASVLWQNRHFLAFNQVWYMNHITATLSKQTMQIPIARTKVTNVWIEVK